MVTGYVYWWGRAMLPDDNNGVHVMPKTAYIITADGEFDQVCESIEAAKRELKWLRDRGMKARLIKCPWAEQDEIINNLG